MNLKKLVLIFFMAVSILSCKKEMEQTTKEAQVQGPHKEVIYQVFTRLFGNTNTTNIPGGQKKKME